MTALQPEILTFDPIPVAALPMEMSLTGDKTSLLWRSFLVIMRESGYVGDLYSIRDYPEDYFSDFQPAKNFIKRAAMPWPLDLPLPAGLERYQIAGGLYAAFDYKGPASDSSVFQYIYGSWLPQSGFRPDQRPHYEWLGPKYSNVLPDSEEQIRIPLLRVGV